ncbi:MAG TPA: alpha/beta fold hydrolase [Gemmatimonadales bacterium]|nr:alpha/beta fold hydrolase [Gemmatimonadales bacterium]
MRHLPHAVPAVLPLLCLLNGCGHPPVAAVRVGRLPVAPGISLYYRVIGAGRDTAIVLHGGPGLHARYLEPGFDPLAADRVLIYYDQRGRGRSDAVIDSTALTAAADVEDLDSLRRYFRLSRVTLIGHHWGAVLAALYAKRYPAQVSRLMLVGPSYPHPSYLFWAATLHQGDKAVDRYLAALRAKQDSTDPRGFCSQFWGFYFSPTPVVSPRLVHEFSEDMCDVAPSALRASWVLNRLVVSSLHGLNLRDTLGALTSPTLIVAGTADTARVEAARAWARWTPGAREVVLSGAEPFPWLGARRRFLRDARTFLDGAWPDDAVVVTDTKPDGRSLAHRPVSSP